MYWGGFDHILRTLDRGTRVLLCLEEICFCFISISNMEFYINLFIFNLEIFMGVELGDFFYSLSQGSQTHPHRTGVDAGFDLISLVLIRFS